MQPLQVRDDSTDVQVVTLSLSSHRNRKFNPNKNVKWSRLWMTSQKLISRFPLSFPSRRTSRRKRLTTITLPSSTPKKSISYRQRQHQGLRQLLCQWRKKASQLRLFLPIAKLPATSTRSQKTANQGQEIVTKGKKVFRLTLLYRFGVGSTPLVFLNRYLFTVRLVWYSLLS